MDFFKQSFTAEELLNGKVILIDKPLGWTSFQVVNKIRWYLKRTYGIKKIKVGHAGTLDPLATGLLVLCTGKMTKSIATLQATEKEYTGTITLGATTPSYDLETEIDQRFAFDHITKEAVEKAVEQFTGTIEQYPPLFSALKKEGKRLYEFARAGEKIEISPRFITINNFIITRIALPEVDFKISCSKGTYIRSIAHDFGKALQTGGHLTALRRTQSGLHHVDDALSLESVLTQ